MTFQATLNSGCNVQGLCGAGIDVSLVWLKLTPELRVVARQAEMIENCVTSRRVTEWTGRRSAQEEFYDRPLLELRGGVMTVVSVVSDYTKKLDTLTTLSYRHAAAERGLLVSSKTVVQKQRQEAVLLSPPACRRSTPPGGWPRSSRSRYRPC